MKSSKFFSTIIFCLMLPLFLPQMQGSLSAAGITAIKVREKSEIEKSKILLGEIAEIRGEDQGLVRKIQGIVIGSAPLPGRSRRIDEDYIKIRLKQKNIELSQIRLDVPGEIQVSRSYVEITKEQIRKIVLDFIYERIPWDRDMTTVKNVVVRNSVILPKANITYRVIPPQNMDFLGTVPLSIIFDANGDFQKKVWATVNIEVLAEVVVTKRPLPRYKPITEQDIHLQKRNLAGLPSGMITDCDDVLGKRTKRSIKSNMVLRSDLIESIPLVRRGDVVLIIAESDGLRITALGKVKEKGRRGERVRVENIDSKKAIYANVMDASTVKVDF